MFLLGSCIGSFFHEFRDGLRLTFGPEVAIDAKAATRLQQMGLALPPNAHTLYYCRMGFQEPSVWIGLTVPAEDRPAVVDRWLGTSLSDLDPSPIDGMMGPESIDPELKTDLWNYAIMTSPVRYTYNTDPITEADGVVGYNREKSVVYDAEGERVLLFYWRE